MKNPIIPYAIIAVLGILAVIIISFVGVPQREAIQNPDTNVTEGETSTNPEEIYQNNCLNCHGDDLAGSGNNPDLTEVGNRLSADEIKEIIIEGRGSMPAINIPHEEAEILAEWLEEHK